MRTLRSTVRDQQQRLEGHRGTIREQDNTIGFLKFCCFIIAAVGLSIGGFAGYSLSESERALPMASAPPAYQEQHAAGNEKIPMPEQINIGEYVITTKEHDDLLRGQVIGRVVSEKPLYGRLLEITTDGQNKITLNEHWVRKMSRKEIDALPGIPAGAQLDRDFPAIFAQGCLDLAQRGIAVGVSE